MGIKTKVMGLVMAIVLIVIALIMLPIAMDASHDVITNTRTTAYLNVVVAATTADVIIPVPGLYQNSNAYVTGITASGAGAVPVAGVYTALTRSLNITGLGADTPQDIAVTYDYEVNADYNGVNAIVGLIPLLLVVGIIITVIIGGFWAIKQ